MLKRLFQRKTKKRETVEVNVDQYEKYRSDVYEFMLAEYELQRELEDAKTIEKR